jgi:TRAP-type C4-dicarboxylate transport system permease small subunit
VAELNSPSLEGSERVSMQRGPLFYIGAVGLLSAMAVEAVAVAGRQLSAPVHGALEIIQTAILLTASVSMLSATLGSAHATVHLVTNRLSPARRRWLERFAAVLSALFFLGLAAGGAWLILEHWNAHEESELLHIPFRPLRVLSFLSILAIAGVFAKSVVTGRMGRR